MPRSSPTVGRRFLRAQTSALAVSSCASCGWRCFRRAARARVVTLLQAVPCFSADLSLYTGPHTKGVPQHLLQEGPDVVWREVHICRWTCTARSMCLSSVICHLSSVICHLSSVICHLSSRFGIFIGYALNVEEGWTGDLI